MHVYLIDTLYSMLQDALVFYIVFYILLQSIDMIDR